MSTTTGEVNPVTAIGSHQASSEVEAHKVLPLLDLPGEIRNRIYHYWLTMANKDGTPKVLSMNEYSMRFRMLQSIFRNNSQIIAEATSFFTGANVVDLQASPLGRGKDHEQGRPSGKLFVRYMVKSRKVMECSLQETEYSYELELPPVAVRPLMKRLEISLYAPHWRDFVYGALGHEVTSDDKIWEDEEVDWLYPIREMETFGFTRLELLIVEVVYEPYWYGDAQQKSEFMDWTRNQIGLVGNAKKLQIQLLAYQED